MPVYQYRSNEQLKKFIGQFMRAVAGFQVKASYDDTSDTYTLKRVPVVYQSMDRVVASLVSDDHDIPTKPIMAVNLNNITLDKEARKSKTHIMYTSTKPETGDDSAFETIFGPPVILELTLSILASSKSELFDLVEQLLLVFNPRLSLKVDDSKYNPDYITEINLTSFSDQIQTPISTDPDVSQYDLNFEIPVRLSYPHRRGTSIVNEIMMNIKDYDNEDLTIIGEELDGNTTVT